MKCITESLEHYRHRKNFSQRSLFNLYNFMLLNEDSERYFDNILKQYQTRLVVVVVDLTERYLSSLSHVLVSTACLHSLTKITAANYLHPDTLKLAVNMCIKALEHYPHDPQLSKNILLTLCSDRILQEVSFDHYRCVSLVMKLLVTFEDSTLNRVALAISSILAGKISTEQTSQIGTQFNYLNRLLKFVEQYFNDSSDSNQTILKLALSTLWNFTDESPKTCEAFINNNGLDLYIRTLTVSFKLFCN